MTRPSGLIAIQVLHGPMFGAFYLASVHLMDERVRPELRATGQDLGAAPVFDGGGPAGNYPGGLPFDPRNVPALYRLSACVAVRATLLSLPVPRPQVLRTNG